LKYFIQEKSTVAYIAAKILQAKQIAIVFGKTIYLHNTSKVAFLNDKQWLRHELKHIQQYKHLGFINFLILYLLETIKHGYYNNKFEIEARDAENDISLDV
jgi:ABC-type polysaccharide transport system permease subunit